MSVRFEQAIGDTVVFSIELEEVSLELLAEAIYRSFEKYLTVENCRKAVAINEEPRFIEVTVIVDWLRSRHAATFTGWLVGVEDTVWIPKEEAEMFSITLDYVTENGTSHLLAKMIAVLDHRNGDCWQNIFVNPVAVKRVAEEILPLLET
jgi:hypothetical protein